ncbi:MAG: Chromosome-partitioning ATPase Soj [Candidatus Anoxychlamydiales bacterium]|nr:Chromosome-partitioning ATPase Soj [Candidatus Anoxychlamydiales bacterium]
MPILVVGGIKGGSGKSTLASNLAVLRSRSGKRVLLVDADEQRSISDWAEHRESLGVSTPWTTVNLLGASVRAQLLKMSKDYDDVIVDTGGRDTTSQRSALTVAQFFLVPFQPRSLDVWTIGKVSALLNEIKSINPKLKAFSVVNRGDSQGSDNEGAADILKESEELTHLSCIIGQRKAFSNATAEGLGVIELKVKDKKAISEIELLCSILFKT